MFLPPPRAILSLLSEQRAAFIRRGSSISQKSATIFPGRESQIVIPANWIEILALRVALMRCDTVALIRQIPLKRSAVLYQERQLLSFFFFSRSTSDVP